MAVIPQEPPHQNCATSRKRRRNRRHAHRQRSNSTSEGSVGSAESSSGGNSSSSGSHHHHHQQQPRHGENHSQQRSNHNHNKISAKEQDRYRALDCEMVGVGHGGHNSALARVTIVDWNGDIVYDKFVKPTEPVTDYRTFVSGITEDDLVHALDLETCRQQVQTLLHNKILVGHALKNDLHALNLHHPWQHIRDTAKYEPFMKVRFDDGVLWPRKLRDLVHDKLHQDIQLPGQAHSPKEDAVAALQLYKAVRPKWERVMKYKIKKTAEIEAKHQHPHRIDHHDPTQQSSASRTMPAAPKAVASVA